MSLKENIRALRKKAGMTQADLAKKMKVKQYNISDYETGRIEPDISKLSKMADIFNVSIDTLVGRRALAGGPSPDQPSYDEDIQAINETLEGLSKDERKYIVRIVRSLVENK